MYANKGEEYKVQIEQDSNIHIPNKNWLVFHHGSMHSIQIKALDMIMRRIEELCYLIPMIN